MSHLMSFGLTVCAALLFGVSSVSAESIDRGGGMVYDDALNITWLQDSNLAASNTFGLPVNTSLPSHPSDESGIPGFISSDGLMNWSGALSWIDALIEKASKEFVNIHSRLA